MIVDGEMRSRIDWRLESERRCGMWKKRLLIQFPCDGQRFLSSIERRAYGGIGEESVIGMIRFPQSLSKEAKKDPSQPLAFFSFNERGVLT